MFVITGSVAYDYLMNYPGRFRDHLIADQLENVTLSFLVDSMQRVRGGVAANIAYTNRMLGGSPVIFSTVGQDFGDYRLWLESLGLDTSHLIVIPNDFTASFFGNTDNEGKQISSFYSGAMLHASKYTLEERGLQGASLVLIGAGDPVAMLNQAAECRRIGIPYALDPSFQVARFSGEEMIANFAGAAYVLCNEYESAVIQSKTGWSLDEFKAQIEILVVTLAEKGSVLYTNFGKGAEIHIPPAHPYEVIHPTGAGDAYRGGFFSARLKGLSLEVSGRVGSLAATYAIEQTGPMDHTFKLEEFITRYEENFGAEPNLKRLGE